MSPVSREKIKSFLASRSCFLVLSHILNDVCSFWIWYPAKFRNPSRIPQKKGLFPQNSIGGPFQGYNIPLHLQISMGDASVCLSVSMNCYLLFIHLNIQNMPQEIEIRDDNCYKVMKINTVFFKLKKAFENASARGVYSSIFDDGVCGLYGWVCRGKVL